MYLGVSPRYRRMKITDPWLKNAEPRKTSYDVSVTGHEGLMVRVHPSGVVSFRFRYKRNYRTFVMVLGRYATDALSLKIAQDQATDARREIALGLDPIEEREKRQKSTETARQERAAAGTVADLVEQFVHRKLKAERWDEKQQDWVRDPKTKTKARKRPDEAATLLKSNLVEELGTVNRLDVTRRQLIGLLDDVVDRGAPITANRLHALLKQLFDWAAAKDLVPASPMAGVERPGGEESPRDRTLTAVEIKTFWSQLATAEMAEPTRLALKLLLVTAQRRGEVTFAKWTHFDLDQRLWTIPVELLKSSHARKAKPEPHQVPLSPLALDILAKLHDISGAGVYVLPAYADKKKSKPYSERVLSRAVRENEEHFGIEHFTPHDLRRTAASAMTRLGIPRLHVEKVLNHSTGDIAEVYDRHDYLAEKRVALDRWSEHLTDIIEGRAAKVVPLRASAGAK